METKIFNQKNIYFLENNFTSKEEVFHFIADKITYNPTINSLIVKNLLDRESISTTGFGNGNAIPHARIQGLRNSKVLVIRLKHEMDWEALDNEPVNLIFCILVPEKTENEHIKILGNIATILSNDDDLKILKTTENKDKILEILNEVNHSETEIINDFTKPFYVAVSACTFGLAHTYLVEEKLKQYAKENNLNIKVETHGAKGDLNLITQEDLERAKGVILAVDKSLDLTHIHHPNIVRVRTSDVLKNPNVIFEKLKHNKKDNKFISFLKFDLFKNLHFGIGNSFNIVYLLGIIIGLSLFITSLTKNTFFNDLLGISQYIALLTPSVLFSLFIYKLTNKNLIFATSLFALSAGLSEYQYATYGYSSYGLVGVGINIIIVFGLYYSLNWLNKKLFETNEIVFTGIKFINEVTIGLILIVFLYFNYFWLAIANERFYNFIGNLNQEWWFRWLIAIVFLLGMSWDSGGIINKWTLLLATFLFFDSFAENINNLWIIPMTAVSLGIVIPCGAAWVRGKLFWNKIDEKEQKATLECGSSFMKSISEGFLFFRNKYGWKTLVAHSITALVVGFGIGFVNLQFFGGFTNLYGLLFSFSLDKYLPIPNLMYFIILMGGSFIGGLIHMVCYLPTKQMKGDDK